MLVGRAGTLTCLAEMSHRVQEGAGEVLLIDGEAGIGKSAILETLADRCASEGFVVLRGSGDELGATRPFAPLVDALATGPAGDDARRAVREQMGRERAPVAVLENDPGIQSLLVEDLVNRVEELCVTKPVALCIDDMHWADASTLTALASIVRRAGDLPLLLALGTRPVPRRDDMAAFLDVLGRPASGMRVTRVELGPLDPASVRELAAATLDADPGPRLMGLLAGCAGNPLLVVEMLASLREARLLAATNGTVDTKVEPDDLRLPITLTDTVRQRMARLDAELQSVATIGALLGTRFTLGDLASVTDRSPTELFPRVQTLVDARLFTDDGAALSFRHALVRDAVVSALPESVRAELHRAIAAALQAAGAPTVRVAEQLALGAEPGSAEAVSVLQTAAEEISQQDPAGAESLLRRALELCSPTDPQRDLVCARLVDNLAWGGRLNEAEATAADVLSRPVHPDAEVGLRSALSRTLLLLARPHDAIPHEQRLIELHRAQDRSIAWPLAESAVCRVLGLDLDGAMHDAGLAIERGERDGDTLAVILALSVQSFARTAFGESAAAVDGATRAVSLADATPGGEGHRVHPNLFRGIAFQSLGRHADARRALERGRALGETLGAGWALPIYHFLAALGQWDRGEWDDLLTEIDAGVTHSEERAFSIGSAWAYGVAGRVHVHRGELDKAAAQLDKGDALVTERGAQFGVDWMVLARALLLEAQGRRPEGLDLLRVVWETATGLQARASLVLVGGDLARLAIESGDEALGMRVASELAGLVERSPDDLTVRGRERRARGLIDRDPGALRDAVEVFDRLGHRFETALVRVELAELLVAQGESGEAAHLFDESLACYDDIGALPEADRVRAHLARLTPSKGRRPAPRRAVSGWEALTPTEHEVVEEVCAGRSNPQVAERLGISRRTVEAHLRSIYAKVGVSTRLALSVRYNARTAS